jgi:hypothetical protein
LIDTWGVVVYNGFIIDTQYKMYNISGVDYGKEVVVRIAGRI